MTKPQKWSETEKAHLAAHYPAISAKRLTEIIPDRSPKAIRTEAHRLGLSKCHERLREMGSENASVRWDRAMGQKEPPPQ